MTTKNTRVWLTLGRIILKSPERSINSNTIIIYNSTNVEISIELKNPFHFPLIILKIKYPTCFRLIYNLLEKNITCLKTLYGYYEDTINFTVEITNELVITIF